MNVANSTKKNILFVMLYCVMFVSTLYLMITLICQQVIAMSSWDYYATYDFEEIVEVDENGNEKIVYGVSTPEQLAGIFAKNGVHADDYTNYFVSYKLQNNIDLNNRNWIQKDLSSGITLDGNGFTINNLTISSSENYLGFVATNSGTIKNLNFENVNIKSTSFNNSSLGTVCAKNSGTIENCNINSGSIICAEAGNELNGGYVGGVAGLNNGTIKNCINLLNLQNGRIVGGIVGQNNNAAKIENCINYGNITAKNVKYVYAGGIAGSGGVITNCLNFGNINSYAINDGVSHSGGIVASSNQVISCGNHGRVDSGSTDTTLTSYAGGIVGIANSGTNYKIEGCYNQGYIYAKAKTQYGDEDDSNSVNIYYYENTKSEMVSFLKWRDVTTSNRFYSGYDIDSSDSINVQAYAGGIAGYASISINNCYSTSDVYGGNEFVSLQLTQETYATRERYYLDTSDTPFLPALTTKYLVNQIKSAYQHYEIRFYANIYAQPISNGISPTNCYYLSEADVGWTSKILKYNTDIFYIKEGEGSELLYGANPYIVTNITSSEIYAEDLLGEDYDWGSAQSNIKIDNYTISFDVFYKNETTEGGRKTWTGKTITMNHYEQKGFSKDNSSMKTQSFLSSINKNSTYFGIDSSKNNGYPYLLGIYW